MKLSKKQAEIIYFLRCEGMTWRQICQTIGLPLGRHNQINQAYNQIPLSWCTIPKNKKFKDFQSL